MSLEADRTRADPTRKPRTKSLADARLARTRARRDQREPIDRRLQIATAAARLFAEHGFEATSVREIADAVNILPGSLYHHFPTKEDILHEVLRPWIGVALGENERVFRLPIDAEHMLVTSILTRYYQNISNWEFYMILDVDSKMLRTSAEFSYVQEYKENMFARQIDVLKAGVADKLFAPDIDFYLMIMNISRIISSSTTWFRGGVRHSAEKPAEYTLDTVIDFNLACILKMVRQIDRLREPVPRQACELLIPAALKDDV